METMGSCPDCGARLESPLVCDACGRLSSPAAPPTPFEVFGLDPSYAVDDEALRQRLLALTRRMHPDYFGTDAGQRELAERNTAELNAAYEVLSDDFRRADWLVRHLGGPDEQAEREMPREFLLEVLEWNEALDRARAGADGSVARDLGPLERALREQREETASALAARLDPLPAPGSPALTEARRRLNAARYLDRTLSEIGALRLEQACST